MEPPYSPDDPEALHVLLTRPLARRILTTIDLLSQQSTALYPDFEALRAAITTALAQAIPSPDDDREPLERELL
jgi:hypothetical protein